VSMARRVVVTGIGVISSLGLNAAEFWQALAEGRSGIGPMTLVNPALLRFPNTAEVKGYDPSQHFCNKETDFLDRFAQFGVVAAREAVRDSGIEWTPELRERGAVVTGSCVGGKSTEDEGFQGLYELKRNRVNPLTIPRAMENAAASHISIENHITGPVYTVSTACSSSNHAIGQAFWLVRNGVVDAAITGGSEAPFCLGNLKAWEAMRVVSQDTCRPFSKNRRGMILGEGGAMMVIETLEAAKARGAKIYAEIVGFGMSSDAHHLTQPSMEGPARAMRGALCDAGLAPEQVGYINAHGPPRRPTIPPKRAPFTWSLARTPAPSPSARPNPCTATRWARPALSKPWPPSWRCATTCCRPPRISRNPIRNASSTSSPTRRVPPSPNSRSRTRSPSAAERRAGLPALGVGQASACPGGRRLPGPLALQGRLVRFPKFLRLL